MHSLEHHVRDSDVSPGEFYVKTGLNLNVKQQMCSGNVKIITPPDGSKLCGRCYGIKEKMEITLL